MDVCERECVSEYNVCALRMDGCMSFAAAVM